MKTWAVLAAKHATLTSGVSFSVMPGLGAASLDGFALGALLAGTYFAALNSPRRGLGGPGVSLPGHTSRRQAVRLRAGRVPVAGLRSRRGQPGAQPGQRSLSSAPLSPVLARPSLLAAPADLTAPADPTERTDPTERAERAGLAGRADLADLAELAERADLADLAERAGRADPADLAELAERAGRADLADLADLAERAERADLADLAELAERAGRADLADLAERAERAGLAERAERADLAERPDPTGRPGRPERPERPEQSRPYSLPGPEPISPSWPSRVVDQERTSSSEPSDLRGQGPSSGLSGLPAPAGPVWPATPRWLPQQVERPEDSRPYALPEAAAARSDATRPDVVPALTGQQTIRRLTRFRRRIDSMLVEMLGDDPDDSKLSPQAEPDEGFWGPKRADGGPTTGYRSKHRLTDPTTEPRRPDGQRSLPRHAAPPASFSARLTGRYAAHAAG